MPHPATLLAFRLIGDLVTTGLPLIATSRLDES